MRLKRLDLARYGKFTGHSIDFGERGAGRRDLHIIFGPNEAGKSTTLSAFLDLLFGIETRSRFDFLHPYPTMRIGGALELGGKLHDLIRVKRPRDSLLDAQDRPVSEADLLGELGGLDRDAYRTMFSLDDETLEAGGESILASKGDLGQLLFSASAGLADLSRTLVTLRAEADGFYRFRARSGALAELKAALKERKAERDRIDMFAAEYAQLVAARDRSSLQYDEAVKQRGAAQARLDDIQRCLLALPRLAALHQIRARLAPLADLPEAPQGWLEALPELQKQDVELETRLAGAEEEIAQLTAELEAMALDEAALAAANRAEDLAGRRIRYAESETALPASRLQLREAEQAVYAILARLGKTGEADPARLVLNASTVGALRELIETRSGLEASLKSARAEMAEAGQRLEDARASLHDAGGGAATVRKREARIAALAASATALRGGGHDARRRIAERDCKTHRAALAERLERLRPWPGDAAQLAALTLPDAAEIEAWRERLSRAETLIARHRDASEEIEAERGRLQAELAAMVESGGLIGDLEAGQLRAAREAAWAGHRRALDAATADSFEAALREDDIATGARLNRQQEIAALAQMRQRLAALEADLAHKAGLVQKAEAGRDAALAEIAAALAKATPPLPGDMTPAQLEKWLARREQALQARTALAEAEAEFAEAGAAIEAGAAALCKTLKELGAPFDAEAPLGELLETAQSVLDREADVKHLRAAAQERDRELKARRRALDSAVEDDKRWQAAWETLCAGCWLAEGGAAAPSVGSVREILAALAELGPALETGAAQAVRIQMMDAERADFADAVAALAQELGFPAGKADPLNMARQIEARIQQALAARSRKEDKAKALEGAATRRRDFAEARAIHEKRRAEMTGFFGVATLAEVEARLRDIARRGELRKEAEAAEAELLEMLRASSIEAAETALAAADHEALEVELAGLKARLEDDDHRLRDLYSERSKAADRLDAVGGDDAAARIEEQRRTLLLEIEERAIRYLRLRAGIMAAEQALAAYRDTHRSAMMAQASDAFSMMSRGAYSGLAAQLDKDGEVLIALCADGGSKLASELSKGTRFQLYLALRMAGYHEFARSRRPVPFIADDIMETFDDFRAEETFRLFADMAKVGQVIYLTHHRHLCDIARRVAPGVHVHELPAASQAASVPRPLARAS